MASDVVNFAQKLARFSEHWSPRVVAEMNASATPSSSSRAAS